MDKNDMVAEFQQIFLTLVGNFTGSDARLLPGKTDEVITRVSMTDPFFVYTVTEELVERIREIENIQGIHDDIEKARQELDNLSSFRRPATGDEHYWANPKVPVTK